MRNSCRLDETGRAPRRPHFIGLGAQKAGTSWIYACLAEHPLICIPRKEIHFFSKEEHWAKGYEWYESLFAACPSKSIGGECSTSYLSSPLTPERIFQRYPEVRLFVSLRNPVDRAYSNYMNDVMAGNVDCRAGFFKSLEDHPEYLRRGQYRCLLEPYLNLFRREQILIMVYEDMAGNPASFMGRIFRHLSLQAPQGSAMLHRKVNVSRLPRSVVLEGLLNSASAQLRKMGLESVWWRAKKWRVGDLIRWINTRKPDSAHASPELDASDRRALRPQFREDIDFLSDLLNRRLDEWRQ